jgi:CubicO group peptidase (beta-lactamase class C family)
MPPPDPAHGERLRAALPVVEATLRREVRERGFPSLAVGVVHRDRLVWTLGLGPDAPTADTVFRIGSVTKLFAGLALLALRDEGKLQLDDPVAEYLPRSDQVVYPTRDSPPITLRNLVTHTSGLPLVGKLNYAQGDHDVSEAEVFQALDGAKLEFVPGTQTLYSNLAMGLVGLIVTRVTGEPFGLWMRKRIFAPLGMNATVWERADVPSGRLAPGHAQKQGKFEPGPAHWRFGVSATMGGLYATVSDMARFMIFELAAWPPRNTAERGPVRRSSVRESQMPAGPSTFGKDSFGINWILKSHGTLGQALSHFGSTMDYSASVWLLPRRKLGLVVLSGCGEYLAIDAIAERVLTLLAAQIPEEQPLLGAAAAIALSRVEALLAKPDEGGVKTAFTADFLKAVPAPSIVDVFTKVATASGPCHARVVQQVLGDGDAVVHLTCERARVEVKLNASTDPPHLIQGLLIKPLP